MADKPNFRRKYGNCNKVWRREQREQAREREDTRTLAATKKTDKVPERERQVPERERHPPELRGKAIGLWYASRNKRAKPEEESPALEVQLDLAKREEIENSIATIGINPVSFSKDNVNFTHINAGAFKNNFIQKITTTFEENISKAKDNQMEQNVSLDAELYNQLVKKKANSRRYQEMYNFREKLPAFGKKEEILSALEHSQIVVISGETGIS